MANLRFLETAKIARKLAPMPERKISRGMARCYSPFLHVYYSIFRSYTNLCRATLPF